MELGKIYMSKKINMAFENNSEFTCELLVSLMRYSQKDWGISPKAHIKANNHALKNGDRVMATYETTESNIFIITEADRSCTTILFSDEY